MLPDELSWLVAEVRAWRDAPVPETPNPVEDAPVQSEGYWTEIARIHVLPDALMQWLKIARLRFEQTFPQAVGRVTGAQLAAAAAAAAYGPDQAALTPELLATLLDEIPVGAAWAADRVVQRVLTAGLMRPPPSPGEPPGGEWRCAWPRAAATMMQFLRRLVVPELNWMRHNPLKGTEWDTEAWVADEADRCAIFLREQLLRACDCWRRWADFGIESRARGRDLCARKHALAAWDANASLGQFLLGAAGSLGGDSKVNQFRKGMLAKLIEPALAAGFVLCCQEPLPVQSKNQRRCNALVAGDDRCQAAARHESRVKEPSWWLWRKGTFAVVECRRCAGCKFLFFNSDGACPVPGCPGRMPNGKSGWSRDPTRVWRFAPHAPLAEHAAAESSNAENDTLLGAVRAAIQQLSQGTPRRLGELLWRDGKTLNEAADDLNLDVAGGPFRRLVRSFVRDLAGIVSTTDQASEHFKKWLRRLERVADAVQKDVSPRFSDRDG